LLRHVSAVYAERIREAHFEHDPQQERIARHFDRLIDELNGYRLEHRSNAFSWLFGHRRNAPSPRGIYLWGKVGRGKTMLMDLFFEAVAVDRKRRVHFHGFMADVHARIHAWRLRKREGLEKGDDPIAPVAAQISSEAWLLCFDEFSVTDIADAMILGRLFQALFAAGVVVVVTSNVEPSRLYEGGLNRALFLPFIGMIAERLEVLELDSRTDFRLEKLSGAPVYYTPLGREADAGLDRAFLALTGLKRGERLVLPVLGRELVVPQAVSNTARFEFAVLCEAALGSPDYLAVAENFHTVFIDGIPIFKEHQRNEAKRFINLIDTLYDQKVKLVVSAAAEPDDLGVHLEGREAFEFERTASRLIEMRSSDYLALPHGPTTLSGDTGGLVET
jgi:cell division protein ZapE